MYLKTYTNVDSANLKSWSYIKLMISHYLHTKKEFIDKFKPTLNKT